MARYGLGCPGKFPPNPVAEPLGMVLIFLVFLGKALRFASNPSGMSGLPTGFFFLGIFFFLGLGVRV